MTEDEAMKKLCPLSMGHEGPANRCVGSHCMAFHTFTYKQAQWTEDNKPLNDEEGRRVYKEVENCSCGMIPPTDINVSGSGW